MIHNVRTDAYGVDYNDAGNLSDALLAANKSIINAYIDKTGMESEELQELMNQEKYMDAREAVERGFIDKIMDFSKPPQMAADATSGLITEESARTLRNIMLKNEHSCKNKEHEDDILIKKATANLRLLNLKKEI